VCHWHQHQYHSGHLHPLRDQKVSFDFPSSPTVGQQYSPVAGTTYTWNGVGWTLVASGTLGLATKIVPILSGSGTYTPSSGTTSIIVELLGGGAGGSSAGSLGTAGGNTTFGSLTANGGAAASSGLIGGVGGSASGGDVNIAGQNGLTGTGNSGGLAIGGAGGGSAFGGGGSSLYSAGAGSATVRGGGGAGGATSAAGTGYAGGGGGGYCRKAISSPAASYSYAVGGAGSGGTTGGAVYAGGAGAAGIIIITEFIAVSAVPAPGFPVQIARVDVSSAVATVDFMSKFDATYDEYEVHFFDVLPVATSNTLYLQIGQSGVIKTTANYVWGTQTVTAAAVANHGSGGGGYTTVIGLGFSANLVNTAGMGASGVVRVIRPAASGTYKNVQTSLVQLLSAVNMISSTGAGMWVADTNPIDSLRFLMNSGNIAAGTFILYGIKK
jgi:hypothetical protein